MNGTGEADSPVPVFYIDVHRKADYADHLIPLWAGVN
jgi:hypothetical protein